MHVPFYLAVALIALQAFGVAVAPWWVICLPLAAWLVLHALFALLGLTIRRIELELELDRAFRL